jgi:hypothetical protein
MQLFHIPVPQDVPGQRLGDILLGLFLGLLALVEESTSALLETGEGDGGRHV